MDIEIHIRRSPGGLFTDRVFSKLRVNELLRFEGPLGTFYLREETDKPIVFLASGTGFGPIKAIIDYALRRRITERRPIALYWGCRTRQDLYMLDLPEQWAREAANFRFVPVLSNALPEDNWTGRAGFVHQAVMADLPDLSGYQVFACGRRCSPMARCNATTSPRRGNFMRNSSASNACAKASPRSSCAAAPNSTSSRCRPAIR